MTSSTNTEPALWRVLDSSLNRASEGLRTIEEYVRFALNDAFLSEQLKQLRHTIADAAQRFPRPKLLSARDTSGDVGTRIATTAEHSRTNLLSVAVAAGERVQQALRCLEEYGKIVDSGAGREFEACRYRAYTLLAAVEQMAQRCERLQECRLYVLIDACDSLESMTRLIKQIAAAGADVIQLRDKALTDRMLFERSVAAVSVLRPTSCLFIVNDRADLAAAVHADGVHVGQDELPVAAARRIVGDAALIGVSTHAIDQVRGAILDGADYIGCGPTFRSTTKSFEDFPGTQFLNEVAVESTLPAFAIGGINASNVQLVIDAGFSRIAVSGAVTHCDDPTEMVTMLKRKLRL